MMKCFEDRYDAVFVSSRYSVYEPDEKSTGSKAEQWRQAFFQLLSLQNTYDMFWELTIRATVDHEPYLYAVVRESFADHFVEDLEYLGYRKLTTRHVTVCQLEPDDDDYDEYPFAYYVS